MIIIRQRVYSIGDITGDAKTDRQIQRRKGVADFVAKTRLGINNKLQAFEMKRNDRQQARELSSYGLSMDANGNLLQGKSKGKLSKLNNAELQTAANSILDKYSQNSNSIADKYRDKNLGVLQKRRQFFRPNARSGGGTTPTSTPTNTNTNTATNPPKATATSTSTTQNNQQGQGTSVLSNLKNTWNGMSNTQKNIARGGAGLLAIGGTIAITNAIKNRQRKKEEEEERRRGGGRRGGVVVF